MDRQQQTSGGRLKERISITMIGIILVFAFFKLFGVLQERMKDVDKGLATGTIVNLNAPDPANAIKAMLTKGYYYDDPADIDLIRSVIADKQQEDRFSNIGDLNKRKFNVSADKASQYGGASFKKRVALSRALLGFTGQDEKRFEQEITAPPALPSVQDMGIGDGALQGSVKNAEGVVSGVLVRLTAIVAADSVDARPFTAYARTDQEGKYKFTGLPEDKAYEVIPLKPGAEFGQVKGVQALNGHQTLNFTEALHRIRLLSSRDFNTLKNEGALIVRTPQDFSFYYWCFAGALLFGFLLIHIVLSIRFPDADQVILPLLMLLTGISFLTLLSLQDPLRDRFLVADSVLYLFIGVTGIFILLAFNLRRFTADSSLYRLFIFTKQRDAANGWPWITLAIGLLVITLLFGAGPEGSGVKVNLLGIQPSEVVKYIVVLFLAGFFGMNEQFIAAYSSWKKRWSFFSFALAAILCTLLLFLLLGDLGPAIVICFTFIILFSFSRGDFMEMTAFVVLYILVAWFVENVWLDALITFGALALYHTLKKRTVSESAIMALVVITAFLTIDKIPYLDKIVPGPVERLSDRKAIWQDAWDNEVYGGDQVANGLWAISSGGIAGQGTGKGFAKTIPEAHTDMILPAIAEDFGWLGMACVFGLFLLYLHRAIIIGRQTGTPFLFYCCAGIGICTFIQFLLIAGGSVGALPLSGVSLPFESYGGSSLVINLVAAGFLLSASSVRGTEGQMKYITRQQDKNLVPALLAACIGVLLLLVNVSRYSFNNKAWVVKPALVADKGGSRMFSYNPRIGILMKKLEAGNIYDRAGLLLATSDPKLFKKQQQELREAGIPEYDLDSAQHRRVSRYYPFEEQLFFWTGDANTGVFNGGINGYFAEYEHAAELRGFKMPLTSYNLIASRYREDRFLPRGPKEMTVVKRDFSALSRILIAGLDTSEIALFKKRNRDVKLSVDAALQTRLQTALAADPAVQKNRVSVVVMSSATGDVLASAVYPLPPVKSWEQLTMSRTDQNKLASWTTTADLGFTVATQPGSTAKLLTAMAAFNQLGMRAAQQTYLVKANERIRSGGPEPDETGNIDMERAIVKSNNVYFIKLANQEHLAEPMGELYLKTGMFLHGVGGYYYGRKSADPDQANRWFDLWRRTEFKSAYNPQNIYRNRATGISGMAWGQGELIATPVAVARLAAAIANQGKLVPNRYVLKLNDSTVKSPESIALAKNPAYAALLKQYMVEQSAGKAGLFGLSVAGKTGTPERMLRGKKVNDGWYVFFAPNPGTADYTVTCIRIEATKGSSEAVKLAADVVIPLLAGKGYIKSIN
ncbi:cell division protein FtsW, lipid II flippase [Pedobacter westerhofensis]|uniref:Probable peptidoglycan glycosyltransferase FtsW n=1 Tax=Pedobacter westerhofensis TaxID=425512 RepID=A0A521FMG5_9SPHI|nr:FtsW/RodA/SpoVE family cell cycle protein [Pedobacter westerhofensis]SMO97405.1 cell division protein FtsW, lipid II flippase [Pedobacter westerhofensis]